MFFSIQGALRALRVPLLPLVFSKKFTLRSARLYPAIDEDKLKVFFCNTFWTLELKKSLTNMANNLGKSVTHWYFRVLSQRFTLQFLPQHFHLPMEWNSQAFPATLLMNTPFSYWFAKVCMVYKGMWHMTLDMWQVVNIVSKFQVPSFNGLNLWCFEDFEEKDQWISEWQKCL